MNAEQALAVLEQAAITQEHAERAVSADGDIEAARRAFQRIASNLSGAQEARAFFADLVRREEWRPIETAPKDGTRIELGNAHGVWIAEWCPVYGSGYVPDDPWFSVMLNLNHIDRAVRYEKATHWRPLFPPPPQEPQA
jgi:hypothetical protein